MSSGTLDREMEKVTQVYRRKLYNRPTPSSSHKKEEEDGNDEGSKNPQGPKEAGLSTREKKEGLAGNKERSDSEQYGTLTQAEVESAMTVVRNLLTVD